MRITVVEDDHLQAEHMEVELKRALNAEVQRIRTECEFRSQLGDLARRPPNVIVMDVMLRWTDPSVDLEKPPPDVTKEGFQSAGLRCQELLAGRSETSQIPVILYTVLEGEDLKGRVEKSNGPVVYLPKQADLSGLIDKIRKVVKGESR